MLQVIDTPGHAMHHICVAEFDEEAIFTGDTFGVSYREFDTSAGSLIFPTTSPTQFDPEQPRKSVLRIMALNPRSVYLTHYGGAGYSDQLGLDLQVDIGAFVQIAERAADYSDRVRAMTAQIFDHLSSRLDSDARNNAAGLDVWLARTL